MSSMQVDTRERGFSYAYDAPLDMRMDPTQALTAREVVNTWDRRRLARALRGYGEERYADRIAGHIVRRRAVGELRTTFELVDAITAAIPAPARFAGGHPGQAHVPGDPDRRQRGARAARRGAAAGLGRPAHRRPAGRDLLPLARGPARQALPRRSRARLHLSARPARVRLRAHARGRARVPPLRRRRRRARSRTTPVRSPHDCGLPASSGRSTRCPRTPPPAGGPRPTTAPVARPRRATRAGSSGPVARPVAAVALPAPAARQHRRLRAHPRAARPARRRPRAARPRVHLGDRDPARRDRRHAGLAAQAQRQHLPARRAVEHARARQRRPRDRGRAALLQRAHPGHRGQGGDGRALGRRRRLPDVAPAATRGWPPGA